MSHNPEVYISIPYDEILNLVFGALTHEFTGKVEYGTWLYNIQSKSFFSGTYHDNSDGAIEHFYKRGNDAIPLSVNKRFKS